MGFSQQETKNDDDKNMIVLEGSGIDDEQFMCSGLNRFPSWWYDDCFGHKKESECDKFLDKEYDCNDKCYARSCLCEDLSSFTIEYPEDNFDSIYRTENL